MSPRHAQELKHKELAFLALTKKMGAGVARRVGEVKRRG